jgi:biotin transport system permease protein
MALKPHTTAAAAYSYHAGIRFLHRLDARLKIAALFGISILSFAGGVRACAGIAVVLALGACSAGLRVAALLRGSRTLVFMLFFVIAVRSVNFFPLSFNRDGCAAGLIFALSALSAFASGALFFSVTTMTEIKRGIARLGGRRTAMLGLGLSLMLGFIPRFFEVWENRNLAWKARGGKNGPRALLFLVPAAVERMIECAAETASALEARGASPPYSSGV